MSNLINTDLNSRFVQDALGDAATKNVCSTGSKSALLSFFGKADYNFADRYVLSVTLRQDGSSNLAPDHRWGTFPAFGLGWRISQEPFLTDNSSSPTSCSGSDGALRETSRSRQDASSPSSAAAEAIPTTTSAARNNTVAAGFRQTSLGNKDLKWEENKSTNVGADLALFERQDQCRPRCLLSARRTTCCSIRRFQRPPGIAIAADRQRRAR